MKTEAASERVFELSEEGTVSIETPSGDLEVIGWERPQVEVDADDEPFAVQREEATLRISPSMGSGDLVVRVPRWVAVKIKTFNGDASAKEIDGDLQVEVMNGDFDARKLRGRLAVRAFSGDVTVDESRLSGVSVEAFSGDISLETSLSEGGDYHVHSLSGDVALKLPEEQKATLAVRLLSGDIDCRLPNRMCNERHHSGDLLLNGGGVPVRLKLDSGDLTVRVAGDLPEAGVRQDMPRPAPAQADIWGQDEPKDAEPFTLGDDASIATPPDDAPSRAQQLMEILKDIEEGRLSVAEGLAKINALG